MWTTVVAGLTSIRSDRPAKRLKRKRAARNQKAALGVGERASGSLKNNRPDYWKPRKTLAARLKNMVCLVELASVGYRFVGTRRGFPRADY